MLRKGARTPIEIQVSDRVLADTVIRQVARVIHQGHTQYANGEVVAIIELMVTMYAADGDGLGPKLPDFMQPVEPVILSADNQTVVAFPSGDILAIRRGEPEAEWQAKLAAYNADPEAEVMLQGDFFEYLRDSASVEIGPMIRRHIMAADKLLNRFA